MRLGVFEVDTVPPAAPVVVSPVDGEVRDFGPVDVRGSAVRCVTVRAALDGGEPVSVNVTGEGSFRFDAWVDAPPAPGAHELVVDCLDRLDRRSPGTRVSFTVRPIDVPDAGEPDAGTSDAGEPDAGEADAGTPDAGETDAGAADAGELDAGGTDAGTADGGQTDAGMPEADAGLDPADLELVGGCACGGGDPSALAWVLLAWFVRRRQVPQNVR